jgi:hypothetical protein
MAHEQGRDQRANQGMPLKPTGRARQRFRGRQVNRGFLYRVRPDRAHDIIDHRDNEEPAQKQDYALCEGPL